PAAQLFEVDRHRAERADVRVDVTATRRPQHARYDRFLVHVQSGAPLMYDVHTRSHLTRDGCTAKRGHGPLRFSYTCSKQQPTVPVRVPGHPQERARRTRRDATSLPRARYLSLLPPNTPFHRRWWAVGP